MFQPDAFAQLPPKDRKFFSDFDLAFAPPLDPKTETREQKEARLLQGAATDGITKDELIDAGVAIARRAAQIFGAALSSDTLHIDSRYKDHILALTVYEGREPSDAVCAAIKDLALLVQLPNRVHAQDMIRIGRLLRAHAAFRRSTPVDMDPQAFFNEITDIGMNIELVFMKVEPGIAPSPAMAKVLADSLLRLTRILDKLWS